MKDRYLEVTYRKGKALAAYLYLRRGLVEKSARTEQAAPGILLDVSASGDPIGLEITAPDHVTADQVNNVLAKLGLPMLSPEELAPLPAG